MLLMSSGKVNALITAAREANRDDILFLPSIAKSSVLPKSKTLSVKESKVTDHVREALESKSGMPTEMNLMRYSGKSGPTKSICFGALVVDKDEESLQLQIEEAAEPGVYENDLSEEEKEILKKLRSEIRVFKPDKVFILSNLRDLVHIQREALLDQQAQSDDLRRQLEAAMQRASDTKQELEGMISQLEGKVLSNEKELEDAAARQRELEFQIKSLEEQFKLANSAGVTAEEALQTVVQFAKCRATVAALKHQVDELQAKAQEAEAGRRAELHAIREKQKKAQEELRAVMDQYGPENFARLSSQLQETLIELNTARDRLRRAKLAQAQQHRLVVDWRIRVDEADGRVREADTTAEGREAEITRLQFRVSELEAQLAMREVDVRKLRDQTEALTVRLQDYVDKYSRQAAHMKAQEATWKAIAVRNAELELAVA